MIHTRDPIVIPRGESYPDLRVPPRPPQWKWPILLFLATCATTFYRGAESFQWQIVQNPVTNQWQEIASKTHYYQDGIIYSVCVMAILLAHEMGHYLQTRRYGVEASPPLFIPMPISPFGTMGAVILQRGSNADRRQMFDIAISGPLAGLVVAVPLAIWGILNSPIHPYLSSPHDTKVGIPLILHWMLHWLREPPPPGYSFYFSPQLFAGWVGFFITALNLLPIGQLDGGHILYCLTPRNGPRLSRSIYSFLLAVVILGTLFFDKRLMAWSVILGLLWFTGVVHPPTADDSVRLGPVRFFLGCLTLAFILIGFTPFPFG